MAQPRFPRLTEEKMSAEQREVAALITAGPRGEVRGPFIALLHNPAIARHLQALGEELRWKGKLPQKLVELAVLITARRWTCQHEWLIHEQLARKAGLDAAVIDAIRERREPPAKGEEALVYAFCRDAHAGGRVSDENFEAVRARFGLDGAVELLVLSGYYTMMAMVLNTAGLPLPGDAQPPLK
ncbi:MAG TPA: carboxymuconolactone decarboxylase family protein [Ktedonobacterales bacterium]|nr:carboxymuconolactone decarboxylase family protein [Ktedonobacterales bacterium]